MSFIPELSALDRHVGDAPAVSNDRPGAPISVKKLTSWQELEKLSPELDSILRQTAEPTIFSTSEWLDAWWRAFGQGKQLFAFTFSDFSGETIGFAPLYLENADCGVPGAIKRLRLVGDGSGDSDNLDLIVRSGSEAACAEALLARLDAETSWDICELNTLSADSRTAEVMISCLRARGWPALVSERPGSVVLLPESWDAYLHQLLREHAAGIERYTRRLSRHYAVRIRRCAQEEELAPSLEVLFDLHQKRWKTRGQPGSFESAQRRRFYYEMSRSFLRNGWLEFWLLDLDGKPAAAQFAFRYGSTVYQLQEGLDPQHYSDRAGVVLRAHVLKTLIAEGARRYDFLGGVDAYKKTWASQPRAYVDICFAKARTRGSAYLLLNRRIQIAKQWCRTHLPTPAARLLRKFA
jgi:CelD/BcsL family acetyltransferase involved in cellulose biosynthesis